MPNSSASLTKSDNCGEVDLTSATSPLATSTQTTPPYPHSPRLRLVLARAASGRNIQSPLPHNKLRAWLPPILRRGRHPSQVPKDVSSLPARPQPLTQTLTQLLRPFMREPPKSFANQTAFSPSVSLLQCTSEGPRPSPSPTKQPLPRPTPPTSTP